MLQLTRSGVVFSGSDAEVEQARSDFKRQEWIRLPGILDRELWEMIQQQLAAGNFEEKTASLYRELNVSDSAVPFALLLLLNNGSLFKVIERITECGHIGCFRGRVYRNVP